MTDSSAHLAGNQPKTPPDPARRARWLLVDADAQRAQLLAAALVGVGEGALAASADQALRACADQAPDLLLLDAGLADEGAFELCRKLRARGASAETPVLVITEEGDALAPLRALEAGAADFIARPVHPAILQARVGAQLKLRRQAELLHEHVYIDTLTGVCNQRYFDERLADEWGRAVRQGQQLGVLRVDIECFALYNKHYGSAQGDAALRRVAGLLKAGLKRPGDLVARVAGGAFNCLLPDTDLEGGLDLAHGLVLAVRGLGIQHGHSTVAPVLSVSMGLAVKPVDAVGTAARLLRESAAQVEIAKSRGGNQACGAELEDL
jgi:diguanylate cyclase (GGDEF)-like protein